MTGPRLLLPGQTIRNGTVTISGAALRHLRALRLRPGDAFTLADGTGQEWPVELTSIDRGAATGRTGDPIRIDRESPIALELAPGVLKGPRMDVVFEKGTELGVSRFRPVLTARVQGRPEQTERWRRIVVAAAEQSGRTTIPVVDPPIPFEALLGDEPTSIVMGHTGSNTSLNPSAELRTARIVALTGPEGGFTNEEVRAACDAGARLVGLGPRILRAETAAIVLAALLQHRLGDL